MSEWIKPEDVASLYGPLRAIFLPISTGFLDPAELGRALAAWHYSLSRQEIEILEYVAGGLSNSEIAAQLGALDEKTVKNKLKAIFKKLRVSTRQRAATIAAKYGLAGKSALLPHPTE